MGSSSAPAPVGVAQPDPTYVSGLKAAMQQDQQAAMSDVASQDFYLHPIFGLGNGVVRSPSGASLSGSINGLSSVAFAPLTGLR